MAELNRWAGAPVGKKSQGHIMKCARGVAVALIFGGSAVSAMAVQTINFEGLLANGDLRPVDGIPFGDFGFNTFNAGGSASYIQQGNLDPAGPGIGGFLDSGFPTNHAALHLVNANPMGSPTESFTELKGKGISFTNDFSFRYASEVGMIVEYSFLDGPPVRSLALTSGAACSSTQVGGIKLPCTWGSHTLKFGDSSISSIRFYNINRSNDAGSASFIDDISYTSNISGVVPEPSTYAMMLLGLLGIGFIARRRMN